MYACMFVYTTLDTSLSCMYLRTYVGMYTHIFVGWIFITVLARHGVETHAQRSCSPCLSVCLVCLSVCVSTTGLIIYPSIFAYCISIIYPSLYIYIYQASLITTTIIIIIIDNRRSKLCGYVALDP
jgi:hypothetical protein